MKKTIKSLALILMLVVALSLAVMQASAADESALTFADFGSGVMVSDCDDAAAGEIKIPAEYNGKKLFVLECREELLMHIMKFAKRGTLESDYVMQEKKQK